MVHFGPLSRIDSYNYGDYIEITTTLIAKAQWTTVGPLGEELAVRLWQQWPFANLFSGGPLMSYRQIAHHFSPIARFQFFFSLLIYTSVISVNIVIDVTSAKHKPLIDKVISNLISMVSYTKDDGGPRADQKWTNRCFLSGYRL